MQIHRSQTLSTIEHNGLSWNHSLRRIPFLLTTTTTKMTLNKETRRRSFQKSYLFRMQNLIKSFTSLLTQSQKFSMLTVQVYQLLRYRTFFQKVIFLKNCNFQKLLCFMNLNGRTSGRFENFFIVEDVLFLSVFLYPVRSNDFKFFRLQRFFLFAMPQAPSSL